MVKHGLAQLGVRGFTQKLSYIRGIERLKSEASLSKRLLACVYQASENSSQETRKAARAVAGEIGAEFFDISIAGLVREYERIIGKATGVKLSWKEHDLARQNVQARVRAPSVWLLANLRRALLLTTSNRSEAAVGYTTMDGDSSGGLSPLGGIDKAYLREWLQWLEKSGPEGMKNFKNLRLVNVQAPTAELRPLAAKQTDEGDLMPYAVLDLIERAAIRDKLLPLEVYERLLPELKSRYSPRQLAGWIERFFVLWSRNQWKRERYAPSFHLDDENLDPKTWCRFPILSGGFEKELSALRKRRGRA
jgi:NAD+ synthase (glutamine-hydrolysing)